MTAYITGASSLTFSITSSTGVVMSIVSQAKIVIVLIVRLAFYSIHHKKFLALFVLVYNSVVLTCFPLIQVYLRVPVSPVVLWQPSRQQETYVV